MLSKKFVTCIFHFSFHIWTYKQPGDGFKQVRVGQLCTQIGTLNMAVAYRTKMTISPTTGRDNTMVLKSDHFLKDISPKHNRYNKKM
jgi:autophagy-related protein 13